MFHKAPSPLFDNNFEVNHGIPVDLGHSIYRITAPNDGALTFRGTNSYIFGDENIAIVDPGPLIDSHIEALKQVIGARTVSHIFVTHTHMDHSPAAAPLAEWSGAKIYAQGAYQPTRALHIGEINPLDAANDMKFTPDHCLGHGDIISGDSWEIECVATPGHTSNHMAFALRFLNLNERSILFSGDHIMAWATTIVAPPDGSMVDYMASLDLLLTRDDAIYFPGHGGPVKKPHSFLRGLKAHRLMREAGILERLKQGDSRIDEIVKVLYRDTDEKLHGAAKLSVLAHLEALVARDVVHIEGYASIDGKFSLSK